MEETMELFDGFEDITPAILKQRILSSDQLKIYQHYIPNIHMGGQLSPFYRDTKESFFIYNRDGRIVWKDHGDGGRSQGDVFTFVKEWYNVFRKQVLSFPEIVNAILYDVKLPAGEVVNSDIFFHDSDGYNKRKGVKDKVHIDILDTGWTNWAYKYWTDRYLIYPKILEEYNIGHAKEVWYTKPRGSTRLWGVSTPFDPIYYFYFPRTKNVKCYAPLRKSNKWFNNANNEQDVQGYDQLHIKERKPEIIVITKAMKECAFFRSVGIDAIAPHGESHMFSEDFIRHIKKYSQYQFSLYDNDWTGRRAAIRLQQRHNIDPYLIKGAKNITDLWEKNHRALFYYADIFTELKKDYDSRNRYTPPFI